MLNIVDATELHDEQLSAKLRVYVETDPVTAELRLATGDENRRKMFADHHAIVTYGENYGAPDCRVPLDGLTYSKTRQPIDTDLWPMAYNAIGVKLHGFLKEELQIELSYRTVINYLHELRYNCGCLGPGQNARMKRNEKLS